MIHTVIGSAQTHGLRLDAQQLAPVGIRPGGTVWGVFVDSPTLDQRADLTCEGGQFNNQSIHMVASPVHPDRWLSCFRLQVLLERKPADKSRPELTSVAYGLFDALARCGVNVLNADKALVGYDAVSIVAVGEFADLRSTARKLMQEADEAARALVERRPILTITPGDPVDPELLRLQQLREAAFSEIGRRVIHRLAVLQARLMLIDELRYWYQRSPRFSQLFANQTGASTLAPLVGDVHDLPSESNCGLDKPWFINRRILDLGENPYYIDQNVEQNSETWKEFASRAEATEFTGCDPSVADSIFHMLLNRLCDPNRPHGSDRRYPCQSHFWNRIKDEKLTPETLRGYIIRGVISRAHTFPIRLSPMPTLGYARAWALPYEAVADSYRQAYTWTTPFVEFKYDGGLLKPIFAKKKVWPRGLVKPKTGQPVTRAELKERDVLREKEELVESESEGELMKTIYGVFNRWSRLQSPDGRVDIDSQFDHLATPVCAVNVPERFLRLRLVRHCTQRWWATLEVSFSTNRTARPSLSGDQDVEGDISSRGLLAIISSVVAVLGFRIEDLSFGYDHIDTDDEQGTVLFVLQAGTDKAVEALRTPYVLEDEIKKQAKNLVPSYFEIGKITIGVGMPISD